MNARRAAMQKEKNQLRLQQANELAKLRQRSLAIQLDNANDAARERKNLVAGRMLAVVEAILSGRKADALTLLGSEPPAGPTLQTKLLEREFNDQVTQDHQQMAASDAMMGKVLGALTDAIQSEIDEKMGMSERGG
jgi:hypothetical protein